MLQDTSSPAWGNQKESIESFAELSERLLWDNGFSITFEPKGTAA